MRNQFIPGCLFGVCLFAGNAAPAAEQSIKATEKQVVEIEEILVSAGRTPVKSEMLGKAHSIITAEDLAQKQIRSVSDALRSVPGLHVSRTGSFGGLTQVRIRGAEGNHVLVLIDGIEVSDPTQGEFSFGNLLTSDIERIEVIRGPQSAFWGSNATAGVINITTKRGIRNDFKTSLSVETGTDLTRQANLTFRGGQEAYDFALSGTVRKNRGFNISDFGSEEDGSSNATLNGRFSADLTDTLSLNSSFRYSRLNADTDTQDFAFPATPTQGLVIDTSGHATRYEFSGGVGLTLDTFDSDLVHTLNLEMTDITSKTVNRFGAVSGTNGERYHASYQATYFLDIPTFADANHRFTGGLEFERETFQNRYPSSAAQAKTQSRNLYGGILEYHGEFMDRFSVTAAIRQDRNGSFDNSFTYSLGSSYHIKETGSRLHVSLGTGITNPTFYEQFGFDPGTFVGNSSLKPEESLGWDVGLEQKFLEDRLVIDVTYFNETLTDEISTVFSGGSFTPVNLNGESDRQGIEISASFDILENLTGTASYTYLDATEPDGDQEVRRPHHSGALGLNYAFLSGKASVFGDMIFNGEMEDSEFITATPQTRETLDRYILLNVGGRYQLTDKVELHGRIENLLNENYQEIFGFNSPGIVAFIGLRAEF